MPDNKFKESSTPKRALLVANLGTPDAPQPKEVGRFLREFLSDPRVVDLPRWVWLPLLNLVIVPLRSRRSAAAYREIWWKEGSPLLVLTKRLAEKLEAGLADFDHVAIGMRYGKPSIASALKQFSESGADELIVLPIYPQYSATTTESIYDAVTAALEHSDWQPKQVRIREYHQSPEWVSAVANSIVAFQRENGEPQKLLFSMHGIPQRYVNQGDPYAAQCEASVAAIARKAGLQDDRWMLTYQSRVGREPWLQPYTDKTLEMLASQGVHHVQVICPGFSVDCLETLEEIAIQNKELFIEAGGEKLQYIPALNDSKAHVQALASLVREQLNTTSA